MRELLRFELFKLKKSSAVYVLGGLLLFLIFSTALSIFSSQMTAKALNPEYSMDMSADYFMQIFLIIPVFPAVCVFYSSMKALDDVSTKTIKNIISRGYTRVQIYFAKYIVSLVTIVVFSIVSLIFTYLVGLIFFGNPEDYRLKYLFWFAISSVLVAIAAHSLNFGFATLFGNVGASVAFSTIGILIIFEMFVGIMSSAVPGFSEVMTYLPAISVASDTLYFGLTNELTHLYINMGVSIGYTLFGILIGYLGCKSKQY